MQYYETYGKNENCLKCTNRGERNNYSENDLCIQAPSIYDCMNARCVGNWATEKITRLVKYFQIFTTGMKNKWEMNYIEICSGPGICIDRESTNEFDGTGLSVLKNVGYEFIKEAIFIDNEQVVVDILNQRINNLNKSKAKAFLGDYTVSQSIIDIILSHIDPYSLNIVFIDPTDCSVPFSTIKEIKESITNIDFIINVATRTDFTRNITNIIKHPIKFKTLKDKYISFIGVDIFSSSDFIDAASKSKLDEARNIFRLKYLEGFKSLGYQYFNIKQVENYYDLLFASSHKKGLEFWNKANEIEPNGQRTLLFN